MLRRLTILSICCLFFGTGFAQQIVKATVFENKTREPLAGVRVQNLRSKKTAVTNAKGQFNIEALKNDILVLTSFAYLADTVVLIDLKPREIFLEPQGNLLKSVDVKGAEINPTLKDIGKGGTPDFHNQTMVYQRDDKGFYKGGVAFRVWSNNSEEKKRAKEAKLATDDVVQQDIDKVFDETNLGKYLPLKPAELTGFRVMYRPSVKTYISPNFNLLYYIDSCYKEFAKLPPEKRVAPKLKP